jgi:type III pantothenate kinase
MKSIFIDAGNTNIKFAIDSGKKSKLASISSLEIFDRSSFDQAFYSSVLTPAKTRELHEILSRISKKVFSARQIAMPLFKSKYNMKQIGEDRLTSLSYCLLNDISPCIVVDAGTAVTIDFLNKPNIFLGGYICAGFGTELKALSLMTANLPLIKSSESNFTRGFPDCTSKAIQSGVFQVKTLGIYELINQMLKKNNLNPKSWKIILTGGDAVHLKKYMPDADFKSELVIEGLKKLATFTS